MKKWRVTPQLGFHASTGFPKLDYAVEEKAGFFSLWATIEVFNEEETAEKCVKRLALYDAQARYEKALKRRAAKLNRRKRAE